MKMLAQGSIRLRHATLLIGWNMTTPSAMCAPAQAMNRLCRDGRVRAKQVHVAPDEIEHDLRYSGIGERLEIFLQAGRGY